MTCKNEQRVLQSGWLRLEIRRSHSCTSTLVAVDVLPVCPSHWHILH